MRGSPERDPERTATKATLVFPGLILLGGWCYSIEVPDGTYAFLDGGTQNVGAGTFTSPGLKLNPDVGPSEYWEYKNPPDAYFPGGMIGAARSLCFDVADGAITYTYKFNGEPVENMTPTGLLAG
jgi:hypothetical protein